jgi:hypothetical protein
MRFSNEPKIDHLDQPSLVTEIENGKERIAECEKNHSILNKSLLLFGEQNGIIHEMSRLEGVMRDERGRLRAALKRLKEINSEHPLVSEYREDEPSEEASGLRGYLKKLFSVA